MSGSLFPKVSGLNRTVIAAIIADAPNNNADTGPYCVSYKKRNMSMEFICFSRAANVKKVNLFIWNIFVLQIHTFDVRFMCLSELNDTCVQQKTHCL